MLTLFVLDRGAIKQWLGHGSEQMIRRYTHHRPEYHSAILAKIPSVFSAQNQAEPVSPK